jgi:hypothetical protein
MIIAWQPWALGGGGMKSLRNDALGKGMAQILLGLGLKMIRTIWLATICLAVLSSLAVGKAVMTRTPASPTAPPTDLTTIGTGLTQDTLGKADRLEITNVRQEVPAASALQPTEPVVLAVASAPPPVANKIISRHWHDPNAFSSVTNSKQTKQPASSKKGKIVDRKGNQAARSVQAGRAGEAM